MNTLLKIFLSALVAGGALGSALAETPKNPPAKAATPNTPAKPVAARSLFTIPNNVREGRDPFFPESSRVYDANVQVNPTHKADATSLVLKGISGTPGHFFAIINNHTFTGGDEGDVLTATGRAHIRCVEIRIDSVVVDINGQRHIITFKTTGDPSQ